MFWEIGKTRNGKAILSDPQAQNSYSYAENNPLTKKDPEGRLSAGAFVEFIEQLSRLNDYAKMVGSTVELGGSYISNSNPSKSLADLAIVGGSLLLPPAISVPLLLGEGALYTAELLGANKPEARDRVNKAIQEAQQSRNPIQYYTNEYQAPNLPKANNGNFGSGAPPTFNGMPNFKGTYDFGGGNKYDYGKGQWITNPPPSTLGDSSGTRDSKVK